MDHSLYSTRNKAGSKLWKGRHQHTHTQTHTHSLCNYLPSMQYYRYIHKHGLGIARIREFSNS